MRQNNNFTARFLMNTLPTWVGRALCTAVLLHAAPVLADADNKVVTHTTVLDYCVGDLPQPRPASVTSVAYLLSVGKDAFPVLVNTDRTRVRVSTPGNNDALTFMLRNTGNSTGTFALTRTNGSLVPHRHPHFVPLNSVQYDARNSPQGAIFLESNQVIGFQPGEDVAYVPGSNDPRLKPGATQTIYVLSDTPVVNPGSYGEVTLTATLLGTPPMEHGRAPDDWWDEVTPVQSSAIGTYLTSNVGLLTNRSIVAHTAARGKPLTHGTQLTYQLSVKLQGKGNAKNLTFSEPLPTNLRYVPNSIRVNGVAQTDAQDHDIASFVTSPGNSSIAVSMGNLEAPMSWLISFRATLK